MAICYHWWSLDVIGGHCVSLGFIGGRWVSLGGGGGSLRGIVLPKENKFVVNCKEKACLFKVVRGEIKPFLFKFFIFYFWHFLGQKSLLFLVVKLDFESSK